METQNKKIPMWIFISILAAPFLYVAYVWNSLPESVPLHFAMDGKADRYGSKFEFIGTMFFVFAIGLGVSWLINNIEKIDPKRYAKNNALMKKISLLTVFFLSAIMFYITYSVSGNETATSSKVVLISVSLLFSFLGNLMNNVKPNYFVGIRTPWTLESEEVWRKTHHFASKLWFFAGLILTVLALILPDETAYICFMTGVAIIVVLPLIYSYKTYGSSKNKTA
ncbi:MAG: SdpI family protein [Bacteroidia bacterium]